MLVVSSALEHRLPCLQDPYLSSGLVQRPDSVDLEAFADYAHSSGGTQTVHVGSPEQGCSQGVVEHKTLVHSHRMLEFGVDVAVDVHKCLNKAINQGLP
jgi:hypothetical protein